MSELKVTTFSSKGRATRIYSAKTERIHHLHSDNQLRAFLILEWNDEVIDIKEGVRLDNLLETIDDKENLRLDIFTDKNKGELYDFFTNFLITIKHQDREVIKAISIKNTSEFKRQSTIEKMEIERRYWRSKGIEFCVVTEKEIDKTLANNIQWVRETLLVDSIEDKSIKADKLLNYLMINKENKVTDVVEEFERDFRLVNGEGLYLFRYLIARKIIKVDIYKEINISMNVSELLQV